MQRCEISLTFYQYRETLSQFNNILLWKLQFNFTCELFAHYNLVLFGNTMFGLEKCMCLGGKLELKLS